MRWKKQSNVNFFGDVNRTSGLHRRKILLSTKQTMRKWIMELTEIVFFRAFYNNNNLIESTTTSTMSWTIEILSWRINFYQLIQIKVDFCACTRHSIIVHSFNSVDFFAFFLRTKSNWLKYLHSISTHFTLIECKSNSMRIQLERSTTEHLQLLCFCSFSTPKSISEATFFYLRLINFDPKKKKSTAKKNE